MNNNPNQPRKDDAVIGGQAPPPVAGVVLGGREGVKRRLTNPVVEVRIAALSEALNYGESGLDLVIGALNDSTKQVQHSASRLLRQKGGIKGKQALLDYNPWLFFTLLQDWTIEEFNPEVGITNPVGTAYVVNTEQLKLLLQEPQVSNVEALVCPMWDEDEEFNTFVKFISNACERLTNLKALFIGDGYESVYRNSRFALGNITSILKLYPQLEVLQVRGSWGLRARPLRHEHLKTLVVETGFTMGDPKTIDDICALDLPALEYLELWLGGFYTYGEDVGIKHLLPLLEGKLFPNLKYVGLRSSDYSDNIALCLAELPTVIDRLAILDLSMGTLTDKGAEALLNFPSINQLHTLNVSRNNLSASMIEKLSELKCQVIAEPQDDEEERYCALYE
ncbi:HEAT repeat domain-containing protein [Microcoleus sp. FACHB-831]|uniref:HEAT repeat domain-containing protein n=1 Tax=Microcoleus sp. FACHB-831 TaxID=2692827 RepID=UPI00168408A5|nr:HEAT repeat domain-containing protein [Microcoleus sp. FACHB-831]MBD1920739.1 HEAT repeat domain-containing protein [Microcoleus sp. FACHB-831]